MGDIYYDKNGKPIAYCVDNEAIYLFDGTPVAYIFGDAVYSYSGLQLGWIINDWIRDVKGDAVFFNVDSFGLGPLKPLKGLTPIKGIRGIRPIKSIRNIRQIKPIPSMNWSLLSGKAFFYQ